jgi:TolB-like protein
MPDAAAPELQGYHFGQFDIDLRSGELRKQGVRIKLQEQPFQVLTMLLERPGEIVTREDIQRRLWPDTNVEFETNLNAAIKRLRSVLGDSAEKPKFVETIPRRGYRFIAAAGKRVNGTPVRSGSNDPSIAVLPFRDHSPGENQEYFCAGITEELTDALTKIENLRVVSRISAFQYKNQTGDVRKIGAELNVGTLLEGSLRKTESRLRIMAGLTNVQDGCHIWSASYECDMRDIFDIQDEITAAIINALTSELGWKLTRTIGPRIILSRPTLTQDPIAYDLYLRGEYFLNRKDPESVLKSVEWFEQAIARDNNYALAHAALAQSYLSLASGEEDSGERSRLYAAGQDEIQKYLRMVKDNYERKR